MPCETQSLRRQAVKMRGSDFFLTIGSDLVVSEVIGEDEDDIGLWFCGNSQSGDEKEQYGFHRINRRPQA